MASFSLSFSDELFMCHICLEVFSDPVTTPCGHNFCEDCIRRCWESGQLVLCPICKTHFENEPELKINSSFKKVVDHFKVHQMAWKLQHQAKATFQQPLCDICLENTWKAVKSCLHCEISFCETHLESHKTAPSLMKHKLIDPVENVEDHICRKHDKPLEIFCRDDQTCLCLLCSETEHKTHKAVPIEGSGCRRIQLGKSQEEIMVMIHEKQRKIKDIKNIAKSNKSTSERNKADKMELFRDLVRSIERCQSELLEVMEQKQKAAEKQAEDLIKELEQEIAELQRRNTQLLHTEDHLHLLQVYSSVCSLSLVKTSTNLNIDTDLLNSETIEKTLACLKENVNKQLKKIHEITQPNAIQELHFLPTTQSAANRIFVFGGTNTDSVPSHPLVPKVSSVMEKKDASDTTRAKQGMLTETVTIKTNQVQTKGKIYFTVGKTDKVSPSRNRTKHKQAEVSRFGVGISPLADLCTIQKLFAVDVILDANTAYPKLTLSRDGKQVRYGRFWTDVPNNPERFDSSACVLAKDGFSCGKFYYEVKVSDKIEWDLGMAKKSTKRKGKIRVSPENGFWCLWLRNRSEYVANESIPVSLALKDKPQTVGVFVDYEEGLVSFYNVETKSLIYSFTGQSFNEKIYPFFSPCNKSGNENLKPLIISNLNQITM